MNSRAVILVVIAVGLLMNVARAEEAAGSVAVNLVAAKIYLAADGSEKVTSADKARPGDIIEYRATYKNISRVAVHNLAATLPIPAQGIEYIAASSAPANAFASIDGKSYFSMPLTRTVLVNGKPVVQNIPLNEYRYVRWNLRDLPAGASRTVIARVRVNATLNDSLAAVR